MFTPTFPRIAAAAILLFFGVLSVRADEPKAKVGFTIEVQGDGFLLNPVVTKVMVTQVEKASLAQNAGIAAGDEIIQVEGQNVVGKRARELQGLASFHAGETRTLRLKHPDGKQYDARLTKPKE